MFAVAFVASDDGKGGTECAHIITRVSGHGGRPTKMEELRVIERARRMKQVWPFIVKALYWYPLGTVHPKLAPHCAKTQVFTVAFAAANGCEAGSLVFLSRNPAYPGTWSFFFEFAGRLKWRLQHITRITREEL
jgi:hypothetical protein